MTTDDDDLQMVLIDVGALIDTAERRSELGFCNED